MEFDRNERDPLQRPIDTNNKESGTSVNSEKVEPAHVLVSRKMNSKYSLESLNEVMKMSSVSAILVKTIWPPCNRMVLK